MLFKKKYVVKFLIKDKNSYSIMSIKKISPNIKTIKCKNKAIPINIHFPTFSDGLTNYFLIDYINNTHLLFGNKLTPIDAEFIDTLINKSLIKDLTTNMTDNSYMKMNILSLIIGAIIGGLIGFIIASYSPLPTAVSGGVIPNV